MREIKFRAWDDRKSCWIEDFLISQYGGICVNGDDSFVSMYGYEPKLMQYTGLKDKNGVEIYEGDILHPVVENDKTYNIVAEIDLSKIGGSNLTHWIVWPEDNEIVGNIYENPDLPREDHD